MQTVERDLAREDAENFKVGEMMRSGFARRRKIHNDVDAERLRQYREHGEQDRPFVRATLGVLSPEFRLTTALAEAGLPQPSEARRLCDMASARGDVNWLWILVEEVVEAFEASQVGSIEQTRAELVQVAAVAFAMIEQIDRAKVGGA